MIYLVLNEGYSATGGDAHIRAPLCEEAIRLARLLLQLFADEPELMGVLALLLVQHARAPPGRGPPQLRAATAACHARAARAEETDWAQIERHYAALEELQPSPVV